ncbi:MAG: hypothetical protein NT014_07830 [Candidatus Omnitrophica bacterium]|nr:hypothetical protein [Candidatus Omnitrophota bacterium]
MPRNSQMQSVVLMNRSGCLLPLLIILNLFFGRMFFSFRDWFLVGLVLALIFLLNSISATRKIISAGTRRSGAIDVEGEVVDDRKPHQRIS